MADTRIELEIGNIRFVADGSESWVDSKYDGFLARLAVLQDTLPARSLVSDSKSVAKEAVNHEVGPLAIFLKEKDVGANQNKRFLATSIWFKRKGTATIKTSDVVKALSESQQQRLGNPADILNQNVKKGYCVKVDDGFYVTPEGEESLQSK